MAISQQQEERLLQKATKPIFIVQHQHSGITEYVSCSGDVVYDGQLYQSGGVNMSSVQDSRTATFTLPATPERINQVQHGTWRDGDCVIYHIPGLPEDDSAYLADEAILVIDGKIRSSAYSGNKITVTVAHNNNLNKLSPRYTWDELSVHVPAPGIEINWEGDRVVLTARDESTVRSSANLNSSITARGRLPASQLKDLAQPQENITLTTTGANTPIDIVYGKRAIAGKIIALGSIGGDLVVGVGWCFGEITGLSAVYVNGEVPPTPPHVQITHYNGSVSQGVDPTLAAAIPAFNSNFVLSTPAGKVGCAYSVFRFQANAIRSAPTFMAVVEGKTVYDPRLYGEGMPNYSTLR